MVQCPYERKASAHRLFCFAEFRKTGKAIFANSVYELAGEAAAQFQKRETNMKHWIAAIAACFALGAGTSLAQTAPETPAGHGHMTHSDGAFHRQFDNAEKWTKVFDDPERDAWQKPEAVWMRWR